MHFHSIWRGLINDRRFTAVGVLTVALGVGATTAVFAVVDTVLLRPFPFPSPERIVSIAETNSAKGAIGTVSPQDVEDWSRASRTIEHFGPWRDWHFIMRSSGEIVRAVKRSRTRSCSRCSVRRASRDGFWSLPTTSRGATTSSC